MTLDLTFRGLTVQAAAALIAAAESIGFEDTAASVAKPAHRKPPAKKQTKAEKAALELINPAVEAPIVVEEAPAEASTGPTQRRRRARPGASATTAAPTPSGANDTAVATKPTFPSDAEVSDKDLVIAATHAADKKTPAFVLDKLAEYGVGQVGDLKQDVRQEFINAMME